MRGTDYYKRKAMAADQSEVYMSNLVNHCELPCKEMAEQICHVETDSSLHEARYCVIKVVDL